MQKFIRKHSTKITGVCPIVANLLVAFRGEKEFLGLAGIVVVRGRDGVLGTRRGGGGGVRETVIP